MTIFDARKVSRELQKQDKPFKFKDMNGKVRVLPDLRSRPRGEVMSLMKTVVEETDPEVSLTALAGLTDRHTAKAVMALPIGVSLNLFSAWFDGLTVEVPEGEASDEEDPEEEDLEEEDPEEEDPEED